VHLAQGRRHDLDLGVPLHDGLDHRHERRGVELRLPLDLGAGKPEPLLQVLLVAHEHVHVLDDAVQRLRRPLRSARGPPQLLAVVEVERHHRPLGPGRLHALDDEPRRRLGQGGKDAAGVEPARASLEDDAPVEVAGLEKRRRLVRAVVEDHGGSHSQAPVAVHGGHVRAPDPVVGEPPVEPADAHRPHALRDEIPDRIGDESRDDRRAPLEAVGEVGGHVELAPADVDRALCGLAKGHDPGIEAMNQRPQRHEVEGAVPADAKSGAHLTSSPRGPAHAL